MANSTSLTIKDIPGYSNLINLEMLVPMNDILERDTADFGGVIEQLTASDGSFYAVPFRSDFWVLFYNKDMFDEAGIEYPSNDMTMEDFDALIPRQCRKRPVHTATFTTLGVLT